MKNIALLLIILCSGISSAGEVALVVPEAFLESMTPWIHYRSQQGHHIHVIAEPALGQVSTPQRVRDRLRLLHEQVALDAVLLVGRSAAVPDSEGPTIPSPQLPCRLIQHFGDETERACDDWYADMDDDGLPDFPLGRLPVTNSEQIETSIRKIVRYEKEILPGPWCRRIQIVAGVGNFSPVIDHAIDSAARSILTKMVPTSWEIALLHANWKSPFCPEALSFQDEVAETINRAPLFWVYLGHGSPRRLQSLATPAGNVRSLDADRFPVLHCRETLPIAMLFCCYGGLLDREKNSVAEELFLQAESPVAVVAASRTTMPFGMSIFGVELLQEILTPESDKPQPLTLGQWVFAGKCRMLARQTEKTEPKTLRSELEAVAKLLDPMPEQLDIQLAEQAALFHLFGDPLLRLPRAEHLRVSCPEKIKPGRTLAVKIVLENEPEEDGVLRLELVLPPKRQPLGSTQRNEFTLNEAVRQRWNEEYVRANRTVVQSVEVRGRATEFVIELPIPDELRGEYVLRALWTSNRRFALGSGSVNVTLRP